MTGTANEEGVLPTGNSSAANQVRSLRPLAVTPWSTTYMPAASANVGFRWYVPAGTRTSWLAPSLDWSQMVSTVKHSLKPANWDSFRARKFRLQHNMNIWIFQCQCHLVRRNSGFEVINIYSHCNFFKVSHYKFNFSYKLIKKVYKCWCMICFNFKNALHSNKTLHQYKRYYINILTAQAL